jgi:hypothetical protein
MIIQSSTESSSSTFASFQNQPLLQTIIHEYYQYNNKLSKSLTRNTKTISTAITQTHDRNHDRRRNTTTVTEQIKALLHILPSCVNVKDDDENNTTFPSFTSSSSSLPIHVGALYGLIWEQGMKQIVQANYIHVQEYHGPTGLLPFALAAVSASRKRNDDRTGTGTSTDDNNDNVGTGNNERMQYNCDLDTIYSLLRYHPDCIKHQFEYIQSPSSLCQHHTSKQNNNHNDPTQNSKSRKRKKKRKYRKKRINQLKNNTIDH